MLFSSFPIYSTLIFIPNTCFVIAIALSGCTCSPGDQASKPSGRLLLFLPTPAYSHKLVILLLLSLQEFHKIPRMSTKKSEKAKL